MLKHVLVPLDGSTLAEKALTPAQDILAEGGKLTLIAGVDVLDYPAYSYPVPAVIDESREYLESLESKVAMAKSYLEQVANNLRSRNLNVSIEVHVGEPAAVIIESAEKLSPDAIVICTHGRSGLNRWLFGSVTQKVLSAAPCPIFVVPNRERHAENKAEEAGHAPVLTA